MLRKILGALKSALRAMARLVNGVWTTVFGGGGEDVQVIDDDDGMPAEGAQDGKAEDTYALAQHDFRTAQQRDAALIYTYAAKCQLDGVRPEMPACLSRAVRAWLPGLTMYDLQKLTEAGQHGIRAHIGDGPYIEGVHRVHPLPPVALERIPETEFDEESDLGNMPAPPRQVNYLRGLMRDSLS